MNKLEKYTITVIYKNKGERTGIATAQFELFLNDRMFPQSKATGICKEFGISNDEIVKVFVSKKAKILFEFENLKAEIPKNKEGEEWSKIHKEVIE